MSTQKKRAKEIKKKFDLLQGGSENKCKAVPYNNKEKKYGSGQKMTVVQIFIKLQHCPKEQL